MEEIERPRPLRTAAPILATEGDGHGDDVERVVDLLGQARAAITARLSTDSRRYLRAAMQQHGGQ